MGIMHKLLKRRELECQGLIMDLTKTKDNRMQESDMQEHDLVPKLATDDNQFTAEHIVQLCKFLAEKSKRNKPVHKRLPQNHSPSKLKFRAHCQRESKSLQETIEVVNHMPYTRLHDNDAYLLATSTSATNILADKRITDLNICNDFSQKNTLSSASKHTCAQEKRDILLKIRQQILERKRQRQLVEQQLDVWRPW